MPTKTPITVAYSGGIGPETVAASPDIVCEGLEVVKTETLGSYGGNVGYSLSQGQ